MLAYVVGPVCIYYEITFRKKIFSHAQWYIASNKNQLWHKEDAILWSCYIIQCTNLNISPWLVDEAGSGDGLSYRPACFISWLAGTTTRRQSLLHPLVRD